MFNRYVFEKKCKLDEDIELMKNFYVKDQNIRKKKNENLATNYKKRVDNFIMNMLEHPVVNNDYHNVDKVSFRDEKPDRFLAGPNFNTQIFVPHKERIKQAEERNNSNKYVNVVYSTNKYQFRDRDVSREIQPDMRFTAKTSLERIESYLQLNMQSQVENESFKHVKKKKKNAAAKTNYEASDIWTKKAMMAKEIARTLLPELHYKTHFQATQSVSNLLPVCLVDKKAVPKPKNDILDNLYDTTLLEVDKTAEKPEVSSPLQVPKLLAGVSKIKEQALNTKKVVSINEPSFIGEGVSSIRYDKRDSINLEEVGFQYNPNKGDSLESMNPSIISKKVLLKCNFVKTKNPKVPQLKPGEGHLSAIPDKNLKDIYSELYTKTKSDK